MDVAASAHSALGVQCVFAQNRDCIAQKAHLLVLVHSTPAYQLRFH